ncbi:UPF0104 family protein, partial [Halobellus sp. Atlit-38R]
VLSGILLLGGLTPTFVLLTLASAIAVLSVVGAVLVWGRALLSAVLVIVLTPIVRAVSGLYHETPYGRAAVAEAVDKFWERVVYFRNAPVLLGLIALGGIIEQLTIAVAIWVALAGTGTTASLIPIIAMIPFPQAVSIVPVPGSVGTYDVLLAGALVLTTGAPAAGAAAAVFVVRTFELGVSLGG